MMMILFNWTSYKKSVYSKQAVLCEVSSKNNWLCWCDWLFSCCYSIAIDKSQWQQPSSLLYPVCIILTMD